MKRYRYTAPSKRPANFNVNRLKPAVDDEGLSGWVHGKEASEDEERFARALEHHRKEYGFKVDIPIAGSPDWKEVDFIVDELWPTEVDGFIGHDTSAEQGKDYIREIMLNETFKKMGLMPMTRVKWWQLETQEQAIFHVGNLYL